MPDNYNPRGALGDLFAPAFIRGYQPSEDAVMDWQARQRSIMPAMIDQLRLPGPPGFGDARGLVDINVLRAAAQGGQPAGRDAITHQLLASGGGTGTTGTGTTGTATAAGATGGRGLPVTGGGGTPGTPYYGGDKGSYAATYVNPPAPAPAPAPVDTTTPFVTNPYNVYSEADLAQNPANTLDGFPSNYDPWLEGNEA